MPFNKCSSFSVFETWNSSQSLCRIMDKIKEVTGIQECFRYVVSVTSFWLWPTWKKKEKKKVVQKGLIYSSYDILNLEKELKKIEV